MAPVSPRQRKIVWMLGLVAALVAGLPMAGARAGQAGPGSGQCGLASWHAPCGRECRTASRWRWADSEMVAAHRTLALGTRVRVVNLSNGRDAVVRITDRGPYARGRIIDVSRCAARQLGFIQAGTARVRLEALPAAAAAAPDPGEGLVAIRGAPMPE